MVQHRKTSMAIMLQPWNIYLHTDTHTLTPRAFMVTISVQQHRNGHSHIFGATSNQHILSNCFNTCTNTFFRGTIWFGWHEKELESKDQVCLITKTICIKKGKCEQRFTFDRHAGEGYSTCSTSVWHHNVALATATTFIITHTKVR